jgi:hypothetical protein
MNASAYLLLAASLCVLGGGCATDGIPERVIEINVVQKETESLGHAGLSGTEATNLFYDVASRLGSLGRATSPHHYNPFPTKPTWVEYGVSFVAEGGYSVDLTMHIDGQRITFRGETDVDPKSVAALRKAMKFYQQSLDERNIKYTVRRYTTDFYNTKSE